MNQLSDADFKQIIGVKRETFAAMVAVLSVEYLKKHTQGGRKPKRLLEEQLILALKYLPQYITQKELAYEFEVGEATVHDSIVWVENTLVKDEKFTLPGKKALLEDRSIEVILVDVTECPIERPIVKEINAASTVWEGAGLRHTKPCFGYTLEEDKRPGKFHPEKAKSLGVLVGPLWAKLQAGGSIVKPEDVLGPARSCRKFSFVTDTLAFSEIAEETAGSDLFEKALIHYSPRYNDYDLKRLVKEAQAVFPQYVD